MKKSNIDVEDNNANKNNIDSECEQLKKELAEEYNKANEEVLNTKLKENLYRQEIEKRKNIAMEAITKKASLIMEKDKEVHLSKKEEMAVIAQKIEELKNSKDTEGMMKAVEQLAKNWT